MKAFYISEDEAPILRDMIREYRRRPRPEVGKPFVVGEVLGPSPDDIFTPEVYVAEIPEDGIPAMTTEAGTGTGTTYIPGSASCVIYKMRARYGEVDEELIPTHFSRDIHNISTSTIIRNGIARFCIVWRDKFGRWFTNNSSAPGLVELCSLEDAVRGVPYTALLGTWNPNIWKWCYDNAPTVYAIDHRIGPPYAEIGWKGMYQVMPSTHHDHGGKIYDNVSLDCELPPEGCNECLGSGSA